MTVLKRILGYLIICFFINAAFAPAADEVDKLIKQLQSPELSQRKVAVKKLGKIEDERVVPALLKALNDPEWCIRGGAVESLGEIGDKRALDPMIEMLKDENYFVRRSAATMLLFQSIKRPRNLPISLPNHVCSQRRNVKIGIAG